MIAKIRNLKYSPSFPQSHKTKFEYLLVSGGSYVWNNSEDHVCTWPYVLKDLVGFKEVYDCSQSGSGPGHVFNSIINEIETNKNLTFDNTLVILMINDLSITDTITTIDITELWHPMSNYHFNERFGTLTLFKDMSKDSIPASLAKLSSDYARHIDFDAQSYENLLKIKALHCYLKEQKFQTIYLNWNKPFDDNLKRYLDQVETLDEWTERNNMRIGPYDRHPTPDAHLGWAKEILIPYLEEKKFIEVL